VAQLEKNVAAAELELGRAELDQLTAEAERLELAIRR
jgi:aryl-alcohol dehydrogenase-like predicted oxidoreductase